MSDMDEFNQVMIRQIRRDILRFLNMAGNFGVNEKMIQTALAARKYQVLPTEVRRHLDYLEQRGVLKIGDRTDRLWVVSITPDGTDIVEGIKKTPDWMAPEGG